jgi:hypothetical protein
VATTRSAVILSKHALKVNTSVMRRCSPARRWGAICRPIPWLLLLFYLSFSAAGENLSTGDTNITRAGVNHALHVPKTADHTHGPFPLFILFGGYGDAAEYYQKTLTPMAEQLDLVLVVPHLPWFREPGGADCLRAGASVGGKRCVAGASLDLFLSDKAFGAHVTRGRRKGDFAAGSRRSQRQGAGRWIERPLRRAGGRSRGTLETDAVVARNRVGGVAAGAVRGNHRPRGRTDGARQARRRATRTPVHAGRGGIAPGSLAGRGRFRYIPELPQEGTAGEISGRDRKTGNRSERNSLR